MHDDVVLAANHLILSRLGEQLSLSMVARAAGVSPAHFHREFKRATGETFAQYVERIRLTKAAQHLVLHQTPVLDVALAHGYQNHETFTRAFKRFHGVPPARFRTLGRHAAPTHPQLHQLPQDGRPCRISRSRPCRLRDLALVRLRHLGGYPSVPVALWDRLARCVSNAGRQTRGFVGLGHDDPAHTAAEQVRFDAAVIVDAPMQATAPFVYQMLPGREWAVTLHAGSYGSLPGAYPDIARQVNALPGMQIASGPVMEVYHTEQMRSGATVEFTEIYFPVDPAKRLHGGG